MANVTVQLGCKDSAWFTSNAARVLAAGQVVFLSGTRTFKVGDGSTALSALAFYDASGGGSAAWGSITGSIASQTDLANALSSKIEAEQPLNIGDIPVWNTVGVVPAINADIFNIIGFAPQPSDSDLTTIAGLSPSNDNLLQYKAGAWTSRTPAQVKDDLVLEGAELASTPVTDNAEATGSGIRYYVFFTLPTAAKFYLITGIEWKNGTVVAGSVFSGVDLVDANPPVDVAIIAVAFGMRVSQSGTSSIQRNSFISSNPIRGGSVLGAWVTLGNATATLRHQTGLPNQNQQKTLAATNDPPNGDATAWTAATLQRYLKIYYRPYL